MLGDGKDIIQKSIKTERLMKKVYILIIVKNHKAIVQIKEVVLER